MATSRVRDIAIDPSFAVPPNVVDVRQLDKENTEFYYDDSTLADEGPTLESEISTIPMPPSTYQILEQRVRIASDGRAVVDVILEFPEIEGVQNIDVGVTKL